MKRKYDRIKVSIYKRKNKIINFLNDVFYFWTIVGLFTMIYRIYRNIKWIVNLFNDDGEDEL